jgi:adenylate cyclase
MTHFMDLLYQTSESAPISFAQASKNIEKALALDDENWVARLALAQLYLMKKEHDKAIAAAERTIAINPNAADAYAHLGFVLTLSGRAEEGTKLIEKAMRLNPISPPQYLNNLGYAYRYLGRYEDAIDAHKEVLKHSPNNLFAHMWLTAAYSASGREEEARHQAVELLRVDPTFSLDKYSEIHTMKDKTEAERFIADLRKAGLK